MKKTLTLISLTLLSLQIFSQCNGRYEYEIFSNVNKTTVNYSDVYNDLEHEMDIYTPQGDTETNRPLIIYMHGGSFYLGDKSMTDCVDFCESFAKRICLCFNKLQTVKYVFIFIKSGCTIRNCFKTVSDNLSCKIFRRDVRKWKQFWYRS